MTQQERSRAWYLAHRGLVIRRARKWRESNRAAYNAFFARFYAARRSLFYS